MDRRHFVAGSAAAAAALGMRPAFAQDAYPSHAITFINPFPPGGAADVVGRPLAAMLEPHSQAACRHRNESGRSRPGRWTGRRDRKARRLHAAHPYRPRFPASPKSTSCSAAQPKFTRADFIPIARLTSGPMVLLVNDQTPYKTRQGAGRRRQEEPGQAHLQLVRTLRRAASADRIVYEGRGHPDAASADQRRRSGANRNPRQQLAGVGVFDCGSERTDQGRQAARARLLQPERAASLPRCADLEGARLQCRVFALGRRVCAERHAGTCAENAWRRDQAGGEQRSVQDRNRTISAMWWPISTRPASRNSGTRMPSGSSSRQPVGKAIGRVARP